MTDNIEWPEVKEFLSPKQIVDKLLPEMKSWETLSVAAFIDGNTAEYHLTTGMWIRNQFNLWHPKNPHTMTQHVPGMRDGADYSPYHPDNVSGWILTEIQKKLKEARDANV